MFGIFFQFSFGIFDHWIGISIGLISTVLIYVHVGLPEKLTASFEKGAKEENNINDDSTKEGDSKGCE